MSYSDLSAKTKNRVCRVMGIIPDKVYLSFLYRIKTGRKLDLSHPKTYSEKLNWLKVYDRNPLYTKLADKYEARSYVAKKVGEEILIPLLGVWDRFDDIDFSQLPESFVLKCTHVEKDVEFGSAFFLKKYGE